MPKSENQKLKLLYLLRLLEKETDEQHPVTIQNIIDELEQYNIRAERKSIYDDISQLTQFGYDIVHLKTKVNGGYYLATREFELPELKLLVDAVQSSRFLTLKKSKELISKLESLANRHDATKLQRQVFVANRVKTDNESIYYNVDAIHSAIQKNEQIRFHYFEWTVDKTKNLRKNGTFYQISPWILSWADENYYLIAYDEDESKIKHFRVDKMKNIEELNLQRNGSEAFSSFDSALYANKTFGMFGGKEELITLLFPNRMAGVAIDRFGQEKDLRKRDADHFSIRTKVAVSNQFYGWLAGLGIEVQILSPEYVREDYKKYLIEIINQL